MRINACAVAGNMREDQCALEDHPEIVPAQNFTVPSLNGSSLAMRFEMTRRPERTFGLFRAWRPRSVEVESKCGDFLLECGDNLPNARDVPHGLIRGVSCCSLGLSLRESHELWRAGTKEFTDFSTATVAERNRGAANARRDNETIKEHTWPGLRSIRLFLRREPFSRRR